MKKIIIVFILSVSFAGNAQDLKNWQVGVNLNPFLFTRINSSFLYEKDKQDFPNGFGFGITIEKNWNEHWGFKTGFESTKQNEKYFVKDNSDFNTTIKANFEYYKAPITIQYSYSLKENLFLTFNQGFQFSFLKYIKLVKNGRNLIQTYTSDYYENIDSENSNLNQLVYGKQTGYKENLFGIIGSMGLKGFISEKISYSTNLRYEYDVTDADRYQFFKEDNNKSIHNFRFGLELGLQYHFSLGGCDYCDNQKH